MPDRDIKHGESPVSPLLLAAVVESALLGYRGEIVENVDPPLGLGVPLLLVKPPVGLATPAIFKCAPVSAGTRHNPWREAAVKGR